MSLVMLLGLLTLFFDEDVTYKDAKVLCHRMLHSLASLLPDGPQVLLTQTVPAYATPCRRFARDLFRAVNVGLRLLPGEAGHWAVDVVKPRPPTHLTPDHPPWSHQPVASDAGAAIRRSSGYAVSSGGGTGTGARWRVWRSSSAFRTACPRKWLLVIR
jgi:hypothetical protein